MSTSVNDKLAIDGGQPSITHPLPPMYPGGMRLAAEEEQAVLGVIRSKRLFRYYGPNPGPSKVAELEEAFSTFLGVRHTTAVTSCTAALICALVGMGIGPGDEVIVPAYTWIATASAVLAVGAVPVIAEVDESLTLDPADIEPKLSPYTRAIIPVHMRGAPCRMDKILPIARSHGLKVLEDVAQANGASFHGERLGRLGDAGAFSLQFNKIITCGEGGLVVTNDDTIQSRVLMYQDVVGGLRNGIPADQILPGVNYRMPELLGAVALIQLKRLDGLLEDMRRRKQVLKENLAPILHSKGATFRDMNDPQGDAAISLILFMPEASTASRVANALTAEGLGSAVLYQPDRVDYHVYAHWSPVMNRRAWSEGSNNWTRHPRQVVYNPDMCPRSLNLLGRAVHIDVSPDLTNLQMEEMIDAFDKVFKSIA